MTPPAMAMRDGLSPSCVTLPSPPSSSAGWPSIWAFLTDRLPYVSATVWHQRMTDGRVLDAQGQPLGPDAPYRRGERVYYWRHIDNEPTIPFTEHIVFEDAHLLIADKPHFLPVTPGGQYVRETLLVRLKQRTGLADLTPLHRIDRETAGLVMLCKRPADRDAYHRLFREQQVHKTYEAIAPYLPDLVLPYTHRSHVREHDHAFYRMRETRPDEGWSPNTETLFASVTPLPDNNPLGAGLARYRLHPVTGKRHQLRVHLCSVGAPIIGDQLYPHEQRTPGEPDDYRRVLQLWCQHMAFTDPVTGQARHFNSLRHLNDPTVA